MIAVKDILSLLGKKPLKEGDDNVERFREFIEQDKWTIELIKRWLDECVNNSSGAHDPYNRAFQDLITSLGKRLDFQIQYGRYVGKAGEDNYDGIWKKDNGDAIVLEAKIATWPIGSVGQLGEYIEKLSKEEIGNVFGLYVIGKGDLQPLIEQILGSKYRDRMRLILYDDLIEILILKEELVPVIGKEQATQKIHNLLLPIESINIGNIVRLLIEIATTKSIPPEELPILGEENEPWTKAELIQYLKDSKPYQRLLLSSLVQLDKEPAALNTVTFLMNKIAKKYPSEGVDKKISGRDIAGARAGLKMRRKPLRKEDIIEDAWSHTEKTYVYKIKDDYKQIVIDWVKGENLWIKEDIL